MSGALRTVSLSALTGVTLFHAVDGRIWTVGWSVLLLVLLTWMGKRWLGASDQGRDYRELIARLLSVVGVYVALGYLLLQFASGLTELAMGARLGRIAGLAPHPNVAASTTLAFWVLLLVANEARPAPRRLNACIIGGGSFTALLLIFAAGTRSVLLGAVAGCFVAAAATLRLNNRVRRWRGFVLMVGSLMLALMGTVILRPDLTSVLTAFERGPIHLTALQIISMSPWVGLGDGAWDTWAVIAEPSLPAAAATHSHSVYLHLMLGGGAVGLAAVVSMLGVAVQSLFVIEISKGTRLALVTAVVVLALQGTVDLTVIYPTVYGPFMFAAAIVTLGQMRTTNTGNLNRE